MKLNDGHFSSGTVCIHFWDKPNQEINFESHSNTALLCELGKMLPDLHISHLNYFHFICLCSIFAMKLKNVNYKIHWNILVFCDQWKMMSDLNMSHGKMSDFISFPLSGFTLVTKLRHFNF